MIRLQAMVQKHVCMVRSLKKNVWHAHSVFAASCPCLAALPCHILSAQVHRLSCFPLLSLHNTKAHTHTHTHAHTQIHTERDTYTLLSPLPGSLAAASTTAMTLTKKLGQGRETWREREREYREMVGEREREYISERERNRDRERLYIRKRERERQRERARESVYQRETTRERERESVSQRESEI